MSRRRRLHVEVVGRKVTKYGIALLGIVLIGAFLRVYHLGTQSIWLDEAFSVALAKMTLPQMVQATAADVHPPFYYFLLHYWIIVFGTSESAVRLLSALFGILAIPMIYVVGRRLFNKEVGLVGALILALSSFNVYYSQETRMYSLMALLALLSMVLLLTFLAAEYAGRVSWICALYNASGLHAQLWLVCRDCPERLRSHSLVPVKKSHIFAKTVGRVTGDRCSAFCSVDGCPSQPNLAA